MAWTATDLANVEAAIASGEKTVSIDGKSVTYRNVGELLTVRDLIMGALDTAELANPTAKQIRVNTKSGW